MPRNVYSPETKEAFLKAIKDVRAKGGSWPEALAAAKEAGYKGSLQGISKLGRAEAGVRVARRGRKKRGRPPGRPAGTARRGRPPMKRRGRPVGSGTAQKAGSIEALIDRLVNDRVQAAISDAIRALENAAL